MPTTPHGQGTPRPRQAGAPTVPEAVAAAGDATQPSTPPDSDAPGGVAPTATPGPSTADKADNAGPEPLKQGKGDYAVVRLTEEDHKLVRQALDIASNELRNTRQGEKMRAIYLSLHEGF